MSTPDARPLYLRLNGATRCVSLGELNEYVRMNLPEIQNDRVFEFIMKVGEVSCTLELPPSLRCLLQKITGVCHGDVEARAALEQTDDEIEFHIQAASLNLGNLETRWIVRTNVGEGWGWCHLIRLV